MTEQEGAIDEAYAGLCRRGESGANSRAWPEAAAAGCPVARAFLVVRGGDGDRAAAEEELVRARTSGDARAALALALHGLAGGVLVASPVPNVDALLREAEREPTGAYLAASRALHNDGAPVPDKVVPLLEFAVGHMHEDALDLLERVDRDAAVRALERLLASGEHRVLERLLNEAPHVLATGGGAYLNPETRELLRQKAVTIWLNADLETLWRRVSRRSHRPLAGKA